MHSETWRYGCAGCALGVFMLVVDARDSGRGRLLVVEPDVLDRCLTGPGAMLSQVAVTSDS